MSAPLDDVGVTITGEADPSTLELHDAGSVTGISGVRVFDVGQGDCVGILDQNGDVFCYVDYGGCNDHPDKGNPAHTAARMPVGRADGNARVVLTHWDKDHYWSANKKNPAAQACFWLVPRQKVSPTATRFARTLTDAHCWPEREGQTVHSHPVGAYNAIEIRKCAAFDATAKSEDRNVTGLAVSINGISGRTDTAMLLAGDCHFDAVPSLPAREVKAIVAYHHGSNVGWTAATGTAIGHRHANPGMCYSHGKNSYGHPDRSSYQPDWDRNADTTADVRARGDESMDMTW